jgi:uncharacterized protein (DUF302 family)
VAPIVRKSRYPFDETVSRLQSAIAESGNTVFITIDQSGAAAGAGLSLRPTSLIVFGNPKGGTLFMQADPLAALDLPLKLLVWEEAGTVSLAYTPASEVAARYALAGQEGLVASIDRSLAALLGAVV